jgi:RNA polymerase sigma-70 factor (ECF subfamily)
LLLRVRLQEPAAWERLVHLYAPLVYSWCRRAGLQESDALDVGQEVFQAVWGKIQSFRHDRPGDTFRGWLRTIAYHKLCDFHRRKQGEAVAQGGSDPLTETLQYPVPTAPELEDAQDASEKSLLCRRAIALIRSEFEEKTWQAFEAVVLHEQAPAEVAKNLNLSVNAVYLAKSRILQRLRQEFAELIEM